jgi:hypothetical protein
VDAKGKTVGRFFPFAHNPSPEGWPPANIVMLQIQGIWVTLPVADLASGFASSQPGDFTFWYQSSDCTGPAYMQVNMSPITAPSVGIVTTIPPATAPSIYYAGSPSQITIQSNKFGGSCHAGPGVPSGPDEFFVGLAQNYPVSSLGFTLPFSIQ